MICSQYKNITDWRLHILLLVACCIVLIDYFPVVEKKNDSIVCLQLYVDTGGHLMTFLPGRAKMRHLFDDVPVTLAPFFFKPLNINTADKNTLMTVKGIGLKLSESIVMQRNLHGPFKSIDDLLKLKGVGAKRAEYFTQVFSFGELH